RESSYPHRPAGRAGKAALHTRLLPVRVHLADVHGVEVPGQREGSPPGQLSSQLRHRRSGPTGSGGAGACGPQGSGPRPCLPRFPPHIRPAPTWSPGRR
ncbi:unnamed protein product, partial [Gulo gulo]